MGFTTQAFPGKAPVFFLQLHVRENLSPWSLLIFHSEHGGVRVSSKDTGRTFSHTMHSYLLCKV